MENEQLVLDANLLYYALLDSLVNCSFKGSAQQYDLNYLLNFNSTQKQLYSRTYVPSFGQTFILNERGHLRFIRSNRMFDRVIRHDFCDNVLYPTIKKFLIYDNGASQKGKGTDFARIRFKEHIHRYYRKYHNNKGYILIMDFSKYFDNIDHEKAIQYFKEKLPENDLFSVWLLSVILNGFNIDVSYMSDAEYETAKRSKFDSVLYNTSDHGDFIRGQKFLRKSLAIGDQTSQVISIYFPTRIDNYIKIVRGFKLYGRYMDDSYVISESREELVNLISEITKIAEDMGIFMNLHKTQIFRLDGHFKYLQNKYRLTESGHLIERVNPKRVVAIRRKLKKLYWLMISDTLTYKEIENHYKSWIGTYHSRCSKQTLDNLNELFNDLYIKPFVEGSYYEQENYYRNSGKACTCI